MDDDLCVMKYIEIVPRDDYSSVTDIKCEPLTVKVGAVSIFYFIWLIYMHIYTVNMENWSCFPKYMSISSLKLLGGLVRWFVILGFLQTFSIGFWLEIHISAKILALISNNCFTLRLS